LIARGQIYTDIFLWWSFTELRYYCQSSFNLRNLSPYFSETNQFTYCSEIKM